jgi:hypothetical protein
VEEKVMLNSWFREDIASTKLQDFYFDRPELGQELKAAVASGRHVLLYGPARQGKTTLLKHVLGSRNTVTFHASGDFGFADLSRNLLLALGCSVNTEQKKKRRASAKAEVKFTWPLFNAGGSAEGGVESELTLRTFTAEIGNPNDVCHLLTQLGEIPLVVIEHFERLKRKARQSILELLQISAENRAAQVVLVVSSNDFPLSYGEGIGLSRHLLAVHLPLMSKETTSALVKSTFEYLHCPWSHQILDATYERFGGALEATIKVCSLIGSRSAGRTADLDVTAYLSSEMQGSSKPYLLAFLSAVIEEDWPFRFRRRRLLGSATTEPASKVLSAPPSDGDPVDDAREDDDSVGEDEEGTSAPPILDLLASDLVFKELHTVLSYSVKLNRLPPTTRKQVGPLLTKSVQLGQKVLQCEAPSDGIRMLAFAITKFVETPVGRIDETYMPPYETAEVPINLGIVACEILLGSDLQQPVVLTEQILDRYLAERDLVAIRPKSPHAKRRSPFSRFARRIERLQRELQIEPPLFEVDEARTKITLWGPNSLKWYGDIKLDLEKLIEDAEETDDALN